MSTSASNGIKRGQTIAFRVPSDTPDHILKQLQKLKETEKRNFSSKIAEFVMQGVSGSQSKEREMVTIPLPQKLTKAQRAWLKHEHSEAILGSIIYQLITDPIRSVSLLASLNSNAIDIDQALYLQEEAVSEVPVEDHYTIEASNRDVEEAVLNQNSEDDFEDDLANFDWGKAKEEAADSEEKQDIEIEENLDDLLGDFLSHMNK